MNTINNSRTMITGLLLFGVIVFVLLTQSILLERNIPTEHEPITVYKSPTCDCCNKWVKHLKNSGFKVNTVSMFNMKKIKLQEGVPQQLASCHTAMVGNYVIEGHVPANDIKRLLVEMPAIDGLSVPGMPMGSPGMEGSIKDSYNVLTFTKGEDSTVFGRY